MNVLPKEERIVAWKKIPESSRILVIASLLVIIFLTPNLAEGYESTWNEVIIDSNNDYNAAVIDSNGNAWVFGDDGVIIYGERLVGGTRVFLETSGTDNQYLYGAIVLGEGEINAITEIKVDDEVVTFSGSFADGTQITSTGDRFGTTITIQPFYGTTGQSASSLLTTLSSWGSNHKLSGLCYIAFRITWDADKFTSIPKIQSKVQKHKENLKNPKHPKFPETLQDRLATGTELQDETSNGFPYEIQWK